MRSREYDALHGCPFREPSRFSSARIQALNATMRGAAPAGATYAGIELPTDPALSSRSAHRPMQASARHPRLDAPLVPPPECNGKAGTDAEQQASERRDRPDPTCVKSMILMLLPICPMPQRELELPSLPKPLYCNARERNRCIRTTSSKYCG